MTAPIDRVLAALTAAGSNPRRSGDGCSSLCPAHDDRSPSLSITEGDDGRVLLKCHTGCEPDDVVKALGLTLADLFPDAEASAVVRTQRRIVAEYDYLDEQGVLLFQSLRYEPKSFSQRRPDGDGGWDYHLNGVRRVLYRLPDVLQGVREGRWIVNVEGEKDADRLASLGFVATCSPMGAGKWQDEFSECLRDAKVAIIPDNDTPGRKHAEQVARSVSPVVAKVVVLELDGLPDKGDVSDWLDRGGTDKELKARIGSKTTWEPGDLVELDAREARPPNKSDEFVATWPTIDRAAFHGPAGEYSQAADPFTEADPVGILMSVLAMCGAAIGPGPYMLAGNDKHPPLIWPVLVGPTAKAGKGTSLSAGRGPLEHVDPEFFAENAGGRVLRGFGSGEAIIDAVRDSDPDSADDRGAADKRALLLETEFARMLKTAGRDGSIISHVIREAWDGKRLESRTRGRGVVVATGHHIGVMGHTTIEELRARLTDTETYGGTVNRFLWVCVRRSGRHPKGGNVPDALAAEYGQVLRAAVEQARHRGRMERTPAAEGLWAEVYDYLGDDDPGGLLGAAIARAEPYVLRLSLVYAILDGSDVVDVEHVAAAYALWRYCRASAAYVFGDRLGDPVADTMLAALRKAGDAGLDGTEQRDLFSRHQTGKRLEDVRQLLENRGCIETITYKTEGAPRIVSYATEATEATEALPALDPSSLMSLSSHDADSDPNTRPSAGAVAELAECVCGKPTHRRDDDGRPWCLDCQSRPA